MIEDILKLFEVHPVMIKRLVLIDFGVMKSNKEINEHVGILGEAKPNSSNLRRLDHKSVYDRTRRKTGWIKEGLLTHLVKQTKFTGRYPRIDKMQMIHQKSSGQIFEEVRFLSPLHWNINVFSSLSKY